MAGRNVITRLYVTDRREEAWRDLGDRHRAGGLMRPISKQPKLQLLLQLITQSRQTGVRPRPARTVLPGWGHFQTSVLLEEAASAFGLPAAPL